MNDNIIKGILNETDLEALIQLVEKGIKDELNNKSQGYLFEDEFVKSELEEYNKKIDEKVKQYSELKGKLLAVSEFLK